MTSEIEKKGNGSWYMLHLICSEATTPEGKKHALYTIDLIKKKFFCAKCKKHFNEFCEKNNPNAVLKDELGLFYWSVDAHNNVNKMNNKPIITHEQAHDLWFGVGGMCSVDCDEDVEFQTYTKPPLVLGERIATPPRSPFTIQNILNKNK